MSRLCIILVFFVLGSLPGIAGAQVNEPLSGFVVDVRGVWARFKEDAAIAGILGVTAVNLPTRGLGLAVGAHWYPLRLRGVTLGFGGELMMARDTRTLGSEEEEEPGTEHRPTVSTRMTSASPQLSLNFGRENGWSYISGGIGVASFTSEVVDRPLGDPTLRPRAINYGGGARWFTKKHLAVSVDLRFYTIDAQPPAIARPAFPPMRLMVISAGVAFR